MKTLHSILISYAVLIFAGGLVGYVTSGSFASILMSSIFAVAYGLNFLYSNKSPKGGFVISGSLTFILLLFFLMRFITTLTIMPAGFMLLISCFVFASHVYARKEFIGDSMKALVNNKR